MMQRWSGRVALVTGAYSGIGGGVSSALVKHGMNVIGCGRNLEKLQEFAASLKGPGTFVPVKCDVTKESDVIEMFKFAKEKFNGIDVVVNNAGLNHDTSLLGGKVDDWKSILDTNVLGLSICTREAVKSMKEKGIDDGHVINIGSMSGHKVAKNYDAAHFYSASKYAVRALTEGTRNEARSAGKNFRVTEISPGLVETDFQYRMRGAEMAKKKYGALRCLQPDDIAESVVYALSVPPHVQITELMIETTDPL